MIVLANQGIVAIYSIEMPTYPLKLPRDYYRGRNIRRQRQAERRNDLAARFEEYLNRVVRDEQNEGTWDRYSYSIIAREIGVDENQIYRAFADRDEDWGSYDVRVYKPTRNENR